MVSLVGTARKLRSPQPMDRIAQLVVVPVVQVKLNVVRNSSPAGAARPGLAARQG